MPLSDLAHTLPIGSYRLRLEPRGELRLRGYSGSAWRGLFGAALRQTLCATGGRRCEGCLLLASCGYVYLFETRPPPGTAKMRLYETVPHPYLIDVSSLSERDYAPGDSLELGLRLFGRANRYLPYLVQTWIRAGDLGFGRARVPFTLTAVDMDDALDSRGRRGVYRPGAPLDQPTPPPLTLPLVPGRVRLRLLTPLRVKRAGDLVGPAEFAFADLFRPLLRRLSMLSYFHTDSPLDADFRALVQAAERVPLAAARVNWHDWTRYSSRQGTTLEMGGLVGNLELDGAAVEPFWPALWLGQWTGVGKGAVMGLGGYRVEGV